ncbi:MAG: tRNA pseudouridine(55) synthase TruB [Bacilli bacterium]|nr:tRNA pseudouridine(55) synthase TruB [Bacilli bacterium]
MNGVLLINKEKGITSSDVVVKLKHILNTKKVGHTGTLDPLAEGLMLVTVGKATKISNLLTEKYKEYIATFELGYQTDTYDTEGKVINKSDKVVEKDEIIKVINSYKKSYLQEVPIYSSVKVNGKKLYEYARNNIEVELPKREVEIKDIEILSIEENKVVIKTFVSKGTYIRSLINDIGMSLETYATMTDLIRTKVDKYNLEDAYTLEDVEENNYKLLSIEEVLDYPKIELDDELYKKVSNGVKLSNDYNINDKVILKYNDHLVAIYEEKDNYLIPFIVFNL